MLTQGWRRFKWDEILKDTSHLFEFIPEYEGQIITGKITDKISGSAVENVLTYLSVPGTRYRLGCSLSDKKGQVQFNMKDVYGASELVIQTDNRKDSNYRMDVLSPFWKNSAQIQSQRSSFQKILKMIFSFIVSVLRFKMYISMTGYSNFIPRK